MSFRVAIGCLLALAAAGCTKESATPEQANAVAPSPDEAAPRAPGPKAGTVDRGHRGEAAPAGGLTDATGKPATLAGYRGKPVLVNLWATWCAPCVAELPTLDGTAARVATVVLNQGEEPGKVGPFLAKAKLKHVRPLIDPAMAWSLALGVNLPTTILYDGAGKEVWRVSGGRDWASVESRRLIDEAR